MTETRTEWAASLNRYDGRTVIDPHGTDRDMAEFAADSVTHHLSTLNEPTRRENGIESVDVVRREVTVADDGTHTIQAWQIERAGRNPREEAA